MTKRFLMILVFGLLLSGNAYAGMYIGVKEQGSNYIILKEKKRDYKGPSFPEPTDGLDIAENYCSSKGLYSFYIIGKLGVPDRLYNIWPDFQPGWGSKDYHRYFCAKTPEEALTYFKSNVPRSFKSNINSNHRWAKNQSEISKYIVKSSNKKIAKLEWTNFNKSSEIYKESEKVELASMIDDAKKTCKELGFTPETEKFSDCSLKLYSQSVELAAKNKQQVVGASSGGSITIYDPVRDSNALMRKGQRLLSGKCNIATC